MPRKQEDNTSPKEEAKEDSADSGNDDSSFSQDPESDCKYLGPLITKAPYIVSLFNLKLCIIRATTMELVVTIHHTDDEEIDDKRKVFCVEDIAVLEKYFTELKSRY